MNRLETVFGEICKIIFPIPEDIVFGNRESSIVICTLSSISMLKDIVKSNLMEEIFLVGRLLSENKGIDSLINSTISNNRIKKILICGKDVWGHKAGHSLLCLYKYGIDEQGKIIGSQSPHPILSTNKDDIKKFRNQVEIINKIGETNITEITKIIKSKI